MERQETSIEPMPVENERESEVDDMFHDVERSGTLPDGVAAFDAVDTVLCALAMRLPRPDARDLINVVPPTLQRIISRCVTHEDDLPEVSFDQLAFLRLVSTRLGILVEEAERVSRAVFAAVQKLMPEDEVWDVRNRLPRELDTLWYPYSQSGQAAFEPPSGAAREDVLRGARPFEEPTETILREIEQSGVLPEGTSSTEAVRAVLCTLARELTGAEAHELAQLAPRTLRSLLEPSIKHRDERPQAFDQATFLRQIADQLRIEGAAADRVTRAVFAALRARMPDAEVQRIDGRLPRSVRLLWQG